MSEVDDEINHILTLSITRIKEGIEKKYDVKIYIELGWDHIETKKVNEKKRNVSAM